MAGYEVPPKPRTQSVVDTELDRARADVSLGKQGARKRAAVLEAELAAGVPTRAPDEGSRSGGKKKAPVAAKKAPAKAPAKRKASAPKKSRK